jgi:hypothetical protein
MFFGADTAGLDAFARRCAAEARALDDLRQGLEGIVRSVDWQGPDAERLRGTWSARTAPGFEHAAALLRRCGEETTAHADEQEAASATTSPGAAARPPTGSPGPGPLPGLLGAAAPALGDMIGRLGAPPSPARLGPGFPGAGLSQEISGIAPGEPDPVGDIWKYLLGERDSPFPPEDAEKEAPQTGDPVDIDLGDLGREDEPAGPPTEPTKPANWPEDMPWPPNGPATEQGDDGQYVYGDAGYGSRGDAASDERPVGTAVDEGGQGGGSAGVEQGGGFAEGRWTVSGGASATEDEHSNFTVTAGGRAGTEGEVGIGADDGTGVTVQGSAEVYAEGGVTVGADGYGVGWRAGGQTGGAVSYAETNEDGSSSIYTVEAHGEVDAHGSHYGHRVRNQDGEVTGWAMGVDVGAGASAGYSYTEERVSPEGWFRTSTTTTDGVGRGAGVEANAVISTDEISISVGGGLPVRGGADAPSGFAVGIDPNKIISDVSGGAFDADDVVATLEEVSPYRNSPLPAWA